MTQRSASTGPSRRALLLAVPALACAAASARAERRVVVGGTGSALGMFGLLCAEARRGAPDLPLVEILPSLGTSASYRALRAGQLDLALVSRPVNDAERAEGLVSTPYASTPLCFVTQETNRQRELTTADLIRMMSGEQRNWRDGTPIRIVRRPESEADWGILTRHSPELVPALEALLKRPGLPTAGNDTENCDLLESRPGTFGVSTLGQILAEKRRLAALTLDGIVPGLGSLQDNRWPYVKEFHVARRGNAPEPVERLARFAVSAEGRALLVSYQHMPAGHVQARG